MADFKVTYFDLAVSRGEEVRLALVIAGLAFDDHRIPLEAIGKLKPDLPFGSLPILEVKGHGVFAQTNAILRLIGRQNGLYPEDPFEAARHDGFMEAVEELRQRISPTLRITDPAEKKAARQQLSANFIPHWGQCIDGLIGDGPFIAGEKPNVADIKLCMVDKWISSGTVDDIPKDIFDPFKKLKTAAAGIRNHPTVLNWYAKTSQ